MFTENYVIIKSRKYNRNGNLYDNNDFVCASVGEKPKRSMSVENETI